MASRWTEEEIQILREMWSSPVPVKNQIHRLPARTVTTAAAQAKKRGFGAKSREHSKLISAVEALLMDGKSRSAMMVFKEVEIDIGHARELLARLVSEKRAYICRWEQTGCNGAWQAFYLIGKGMSERKPKKMTQKERNARFEKKIDPLELQIRRQRYTLRQKKDTARRDPIVAAFFGQPGANQ